VHVVARSAQALLGAALLLASPLPARAGVNHAEYFDAVSQMMTELAPQSAAAAIAIRDTYRPYLDFLVLRSYEQIQQALGNGGLVPLPDPRRFNLVPPLEGTSPIGEKDLGNQDSYLSARAATIGCLLRIASLVTSGPVEVTSLVRHTGYQNTLLATNVNATTEVPMHTMGLAFDIAIVNTPLETVLEIRDVLQRMQDAGDILVIGERGQLVFHVVPHPSRLGYFSEVYAGAMEAGLPFAVPVDLTLPLAPRVTADVVSLEPMPEFAAEWWDADNVPVDQTVVVTAAAPADALESSYLEQLGEFVVSAWEKMTRWTTLS